MKIERNKVTAFWYAGAVMILRPEGRPIPNLIFKLDTGARLTTVPYKVLVENGISESMIKGATRARITVADGRKIPDSYILKVSEIHILGKNFRNFEVATSLSANMGFLLGQNILECFDWELNYSTGLAIATHRRNFAPQSMSSQSKAVDELGISTDT